MSDDRGHLRAVRLLPFAAAVDVVRLTLKRQIPIPVDLQAKLCFPQQILLQNKL
jgi:hypothetical protein